MSKRLPDPRRDSVHSRIGGSSQGSPPKPINMQTQQRQPVMTAFPSPAPVRSDDARMYTQEQVDAINAEHRAVRAQAATLGLEEGQRFIHDYKQRQMWAQMSLGQRQACQQQQQQQQQRDQLSAPPPSLQGYKGQNGRVYTREKIEARKAEQLAKLIPERRAQLPQHQQQRTASVASPTTPFVIDGQGRKWPYTGQQRQPQRPAMAASPTSMHATDKNGHQYTPQEYARHIADLQAYAQAQMYPENQVLHQQQQQLTIATSPAHALADQNGCVLTPEQYEELRRKAGMRVQMAQMSPEGQAPLKQQRILTTAMSPTHPMIDRNGRQWTQEEAQAMHRQRVAMQSQISPTRIAQRQQAQGGQSVPTPTPFTMDTEFLPQHMSFYPTQQCANSPPGSSAFSPRTLSSNFPDIAQTYSQNQNSQNHGNGYYLSPSLAHSQSTNGYQPSNDHLTRMPQAGSPAFSPNMPNLGLSNSLSRRPSQHVDLQQPNAFAVPQSPDLFQSQQTKSPVARTPTPLSASFSPQLLGSNDLQSPVHNAFSHLSAQLQGANGHQFNAKVKANTRANVLKPHSQLKHKVHKVQRVSGTPNSQPKNRLSGDHRLAALTAKVKSNPSSVLKPPQVTVKPTPAQSKSSPKVVPSKPAALQRVPTPKTAPPKPTASQRIPTPAIQSSPAPEPLLVAGTKRSFPNGENAYAEEPIPKAAMFSTGPLSRPTSSQDVGEAQLQKHKIPGSKAGPFSRLTNEAIKHGVHTLKVPEGSFAVDDVQVNESQKPGHATTPSPGYAEGMMEIKRKAALDKMQAENNENLLLHLSSSQRLLLGLPTKYTSFNGQITASAMCAPHEIIDLTKPEKLGPPISASPRIAAAKANKARRTGQPTHEEPDVHRLHLFALQNGVRMNDVEHGPFVHEAMTSYISTQKEIRYRRSMLDPPAETLQQLANSSTLSDTGWGNNTMDSEHAEALGLPVNFSMQPVLKKVRDPHYNGFEYSGNNGGKLPPAGVDLTIICMRDDDDGSFRAPNEPSMSEEAAVLQYDLIEVRTEEANVWGADERGRATWG